jgi:hypothetical protein
LSGILVWKREANFFTLVLELFLSASSSKSTDLDVCRSAELPDLWGGTEPPDLWSGLSKDFDLLAFGKVGNASVNFDFLAKAGAPTASSASSIESAFDTTA